MTEGAEPHCTNGHPITAYPVQFRQSTRIGINFKGWVEYANIETGLIYEMKYAVSDEGVIEELKQHEMLGDTISEHISESIDRFGDWSCVEG